MKIILKDIPRLDNFDVVGVANEPDEHYDNRRLTVVDDSYVLQGDDVDITTQELINEIVKKSYGKHETAGKEYFNQVRTDIYIQFTTGGLTESEIYDIEDKLETTINRVKRGDWMTAKHTLESVVVGGALSQELYDSIMNYITDYITNNY